MKATLFLVLFSLALVLAQVPGGAPVASWAGSLVNVSSWTGVPNVASSTQACTITNTTASNYVVVNTTFTTAGPYQALALAVNNINLFVYNGSFNAQDPCGNLRAELTANNGALNNYGPDVEDTYWFSTGVTYFFVISADGTAGDFSLGLYFLNASGVIGSTNTWSPFTTSGSACSQISTNVPYASYQWTAAATGLVDVFAGFPVNITGSWSNSYVAVFAGAMSATQLNSDTLCSQTGLSYNGPESGRAAHLYGVRVTAGQIYTVVVSGSTTTSYANYGISVVPSRLVPALFLAPGFVQPVIGSLPCTASTTYTNASFVATSVTTANNNYKVLVSLPTLASGSNSNWTTASSSYSAGFVYQGQNTGSTTTAPMTCNAAAPLVASTTSFPASINSAASTQYSLVAAYWGSGSASGYASYNAYIVYVQTGAPAGSFTPSTPSTTGSGATNGGVASGTHSTTGNFTTGTTSSSSSVVCSFVFVVLAIIALMF